MKLEKSKKGEPLFKIGIKEENIIKYKVLKRSLMEGEKITGRYNYNVPLRFFVPVFNNIPKQEIRLDRTSKLEYFEYWDEFEEKYYSSIDITPKFMKNWRKEKCPEIFKISINKETLELKKEVAFKRITRVLEDFK